MKQSAEALEGLTEDYTTLQEELKHTEEYYEQLQKEALLVKQEQNALGESVSDLAKKYNVSGASITSSLEYQTEGLQAWEDAHIASLNNAGESVDIVAARWGTTVDAVRQAMADNNLDLQGWEDEQTRLYEEWLQTATENIDGGCSR